MDIRFIQRMLPTGCQDLNHQLNRNNMKMEEIKELVKTMKGWNPFESVRKRNEELIKQAIEVEKKKCECCGHMLPKSYFDGGSNRCYIC